MLFAYFTGAITNPPTKGITMSKFACFLLGMFTMSAGSAAICYVIGQKKPDALDGMMSVYK
jgi:hypothetical protein